ncbi:hypothetical protein DPMN_165925 [Dreissena polymorpha]|uniref:Uncharacterized protein n=1 Tax=Dreissena polymorpha TaxID=45954 RepID=A0A9D4F0L6_DREPO|nr:hypothetical protein DPMN_165925 [Dreissena polymorpha]
MARQRPTRAPQVEIDRIVIREVQYQIEVNRCRNEEIIVKYIFGWVLPIMEYALQAEIDRIVIRDVQYQFEVNRCRNEEIIVKGNFGWEWPMLAGRFRVGNGTMHKVQYQFEVNRCRNEEIIVKGNFWWAWPMWAGRPRINCIVIREAQYQFEMNRCRNEEIIVKGNFGWAWLMLAWPIWAGRPRIDRIFQGSSANSDGRTDGQTHITTISPLFLRKTWGYKCVKISDPLTFYPVVQSLFQIGSSANTDGRTDRRPR